MYCLALSCSDEDAFVNNNKDTHEKVDMLLREVVKDWSATEDDVLEAQTGYTISEQNKDVLCFTDKSKGVDIIYRFHNKQLCATLVVWNKKYSFNALSDYVYLGILDGCDIYANLSHNIMAATWVENEGDADYRTVVAFAPIDSDAYKSVEPVSAITGDCERIGDMFADLSGEVTGVTSAVEVGFVYGTTNNLSPFSDKKVSSKSTASFKITISGLNENTKYYYCAYALVDGIYYLGDIKEFVSQELDLSKAMDLASSGNANCYIVTDSGRYRFPTYKGNGKSAVGVVHSVETLWESFGTSKTPKVGDLIKFVCYKNGYVVFQTADSYNKGNAVIAAKDENGTILWSWHIWLTDQPQGQTYYNNAGTMMDRNLGATSATPGDVGALGLHYQWGRKDPFLNSYSISTSSVAKSTITWPNPVQSDSSTGTIQFAIENPTTFITANSRNDDWYYSFAIDIDKTRWTTSSNNKSIYDPCPVGWRVPDGGANGTWATALGFSNGWNHVYKTTTKGMNFSGKFGSSATIWYPAVGFRKGTDGTLGYVGSTGGYWTTTTQASGNISVYYLAFFDNGEAYPSYSRERSYGYAVRCIKE